MRLVVSDLDGTLLRSDRSISNRTLKVLAELESRNILFMIATARAPRHVYQVLPFNFDNMYAIYYNGAEIYHGSKLIYCNYIKENEAKYIVEWLLKYYPEIHIALEVSNKLYTNFDIAIIKGWDPPFEQVDFCNFDYGPTAKILVDLRGSDVATITGMLPNSCAMIVTDGGVVGQIAQQDVSKINAIKNLATSFGFGLEEVVTFGDDYNDIEMIRESGIGVAMKLAPQAVKDAANIVTVATNDEDGVAIELERLLRSF